MSSAPFKQPDNNLSKNEPQMTKNQLITVSQNITFKLRSSGESQICAPHWSCRMPCPYSTCLQLPHANSVLRTHIKHSPFSTIKLSHSSACLGVSAKQKWWWLTPCYSKLWINKCCFFSFDGLHLFLHNRFKMLYKLRGYSNKCYYDYYFGYYFSNYGP